MKIAILLGLPLSGKTTHCKVLNSQDTFDFELPLVETGTFVYKEVEERGESASPENIKKIVAECKAISDAYFTEKAIEFVKNEYSEAPIVFLSGVKARSEVEAIESMVGENNVSLISFHASFKTRHSRLLNKDRQESLSEKKREEDKAMAENPDRLRFRDQKELGYGLGDLMALATYVINTEDRLWPHNKFEQTLEDFTTVTKNIING